MSIENNVFLLPQELKNEFITDKKSLIHSLFLVILSITLSSSLVYAALIYIHVLGIWVSDIGVFNHPLPQPTGLCRAKK